MDNKSRHSVPWGTFLKQPFGDQLSPPVQIVRRYLGTTPTGRFVVELLKDATGKPHRAHLDPKQWHAYYRIVRHW